jgi:hypothetical protein
MALMVSPIIPTPAAFLVPRVTDRDLDRWRGERKVDLAIDRDRGAETVTEVDIVSLALDVFRAKGHDQKFYTSTFAIAVFLNPV